MNKFQSSSLRLFLISGICFIVILLFVGVTNFFWSPPQGIHFSRLIDSFAYSFYYFTTDTGFFEPGNLNLTSRDGKCASEFPLIYYLAGISYSVFGVNYVSLKLITILLLFLGFLYSVKLIHLLSNSILAAVSLSSVFFSSTVILYYGTFYLPDIHSLGLVLVSFYYFFKYQHESENKYLIILYLFATLSSLIKASFYFYEFSFLIALFFIDRKNGKSPKTSFLFFLISSILVFSWFVYVKKYNEINAAWYYTTGPRPFWKSSNERIAMAFEYMWGYWYSKYYFQSAFHLYFITICLGMFFLIKNRLYLLLVSSLIFFDLVYLSLFLTQFIHHDYYFVVIVPSIIIIVTLCYLEVKHLVKNKWIQYVISLTIVVIAALSIDYAKLNLSRRYSNNYDSLSAPRYQMFGSDAFIDSLKIEKSAKFLVVGDKTYNGSLVFLKRFGWIYSSFESDSAQILSTLSFADFLVVLKPSENKIPYALRQRLLNCKKYTYNSNYLYSLRDCE